MKKQTKELITTLVREYITVFPEEYNAFCKAQTMQKHELETDTAEVKGDHVMQRKLHEIPETLFFSIKARLSDEQFEEFVSLQGGRWFARTFMSFRSGHEV